MGGLLGGQFHLAARFLRWHSSIRARASSDCNSGTREATVSSGRFHHLIASNASTMSSGKRRRVLKSGISNRDTIRRYVPADDRACANYGAVTNIDAGKDSGPSPDPDVRADRDVTACDVLFVAATLGRGPSSHAKWKRRDPVGAVIAAKINFDVRRYAAILANDKPCIFERMDSRNTVGEITDLKAPLFDIAAQHSPCFVPWIDFTMPKKIREPGHGKCSIRESGPEA